MSGRSTHGSRVVMMAGGTLASRLTGLLRVLVLAWVLGFSPLADAFNLANTVPNMLFDLVLGGIVGATFIPVFVERLALEGERRAWKSISTVVTASLLVLLVATVLAWWAAPWIIDGFTVMQHRSALRSANSLHHERAVATALLRWFSPQIFFYGIIGVATALLNIRNRFAAASWVPVANNAVCIAVLVWFHLVDPTPNLADLAGTHYLLWLGLGTTLGVAVQFLCLLPSLGRSDLWRLSFRLDLHDPALRAIGRLGSWTLLVVIANQISLFVVLALAFGIGGSGPVSAFTYGWSFMMMPYAVVVVSVLGVLNPQFAALATQGDYEGLSERLRFGLRQSLVIILPCTVTLIILSQPIAAILLNHLDASRTLPVGTVLAVLAAGLPGFTIFQLSIRGLQSMQRAREVFLLYVVENGLTILLGLGSSLPRRTDRQPLPRLQCRRPGGTGGIGTSPRTHLLGPVVGARAPQRRGVPRGGPDDGVGLRGHDGGAGRRPRGPIHDGRPRGNRDLRRGNRLDPAANRATHCEKCEA